ncbi:uncharacterized protein HHUB_3428 [Halobacterium hubeiense]|uniref:Uncharacterized protein n=1 Tax=Halobacterium hubeiense TaxID=1407499 RepID=A0A0U5D0H0_9EURY|nr:hypothetical protein [Halobacterium hubeiense]CQH61340.1 uncharacterized protein HHUB_3428 [Halobacterium hubeiense]
MSRVRPALAAVLLVVATTATLAASGGVAAPVEPGDEPVVGTSEQSAHVLLLTEANTAAYNEPRASVTSTLESGHATLGTDLRLATVEQRLDAADNRSARREILRNATDEAAERVAALRERATAAHDAYRNGELSTGSYVRTLGTIHAEASSLSTTLGRTASGGSLYNHAISDSFSEIGTRVYRLRAQLATVQGPVREHVADVVHGNREQVRVHVTAGNGVMLSTIDDGTYVRETVRPDNVEETLGGDFADASTVIQSKYPWLSNNSRSPSIIETRGGYAFYYRANYGHGQITAYIDTTTEKVYAERHQQTLAQLPADVEQRDTANNVTLSTSRTYAGGPLLVRAENEAGEPIDTTVSLNGTSVGDTGDDGRLWVLSPAGEYNVATVHDGAALEVNVTARPAP